MESSLLHLRISSRNCIGQNLAWEELYWAIDFIVRSGLILELGSEMRPWEMNKQDRLNVAPRGRRLMLSVSKDLKGQ